MQFSDMFVLYEAPVENRFSRKNAELETINLLSDPSVDSMVSAIVVSENIATNEKHASHVLRFKNNCNASSLFFKSEYEPNQIDKLLYAISENVASQSQLANYRNGIRSPFENHTLFNASAPFSNGSNAFGYPPSMPNSTPVVRKISTIKYTDVVKLNYRINCKDAEPFDDNAIKELPINVVLWKVVGNALIPDCMLAKVSFEISNDEELPYIDFVGIDRSLPSICKYVMDLIIENGEERPPLPHTSIVVTQCVEDIIDICNPQSVMMLRNMTLTSQFAGGTLMSGLSRFVNSAASVSTDEE